MVQIGESNKQIIELAQNWCAHLTIERWGGTGIVEVETGLPIGARYFRCPHARAAGCAGVDLKFVALDFYDRNCVGCDKRSPVRFPNMSTTLVSERDANRLRGEEAGREAAENAAKALGVRTDRRKELSRNTDPPTAGIFSQIDELDLQPGDRTRRVLLETAAAAPSRFNSQVQDALFELADAGGFARTEAALEVLRSVGAERNRLCESALRALARGDGHEVAGSIVAGSLSEAHRSLVCAALPALIRLAHPVRGFLVERGSPGNSKSLEAAYRLFPDLVKATIFDQLRNPEKYVRIRACNSIAVITRFDASFGPGVAEELIKSLELPDDHYGEEGSAEGWVQSTLAEILLDYPDEIDAMLQRETSRTSEDIRSALFDVYEQVLRSARELKEPLTRGHESAHERMLELLAQPPDNERLLTLISYLRDEANGFPDMLDRSSEKLLGAAALIASDLDAPSSPLLDLDVRPNSLKTIETATRRQLLRSALDATMEALGTVAARKPLSVGRSLVQTFEALDDRAAYFKAGLLKCLGRMATKAEGVPLALPWSFYIFSVRCLNPILSGVGSRFHKQVCPRII